MSSGGGGAASAAEEESPAAAVDAWRERGADRLHPVRFRFIEALARRAAALDGEARRVVDDRVRQLLVAYGNDFERALRAHPDGDNAAASPSRANAPPGRSHAAAAAEVRQPHAAAAAGARQPHAAAAAGARQPHAAAAAGARQPHATKDARAGHPHGAVNAAASGAATGERRGRYRGPVTELVEYIARHAPAQKNGGTADAAALTGLDGPAELQTLRHFRSTWARLNADRRLARSLAKLPESAGPLNSHQLVHRALVLMRDVSPEYLERFASHVDALLWLEQATAGNVSQEQDARRGAGERKAARNRAR